MSNTFQLSSRLKNMKFMQRKSSSSTVHGNATTTTTTTTTHIQPSSSFPQEPIIGAEPLSHEHEISKREFLHHELLKPQDTERRNSKSSARIAASNNPGAGASAGAGTSVDAGRPKDFSANHAFLSFFGAQNSQPAKPAREPSMSPAVMIQEQNNDPLFHTAGAQVHPGLRIGRQSFGLFNPMLENECGHGDGHSNNHSKKRSKQMSTSKHSDKGNTHKRRNRDGDYERERKKRKEQF